MSYIVLPIAHEYYFKHFSTFKMNVVCANSNNCGYVPQKIIDMHIDMASCAEQECGIQKLKELFNEKTPVEIDSYDGFKVVRIGMPKTIWLPNEDACIFMREDLERNNGMLAYWDNASVAFVVQLPRLAEMLKQFLENVSYISYNEKVQLSEHRGLTLK